jgi:three-Cys-motif partner protein
VIHVHALKRTLFGKYSSNQSRVKERVFLLFGVWTPPERDYLPTRDLHQKPFDTGTRTKLRIYRSYLQGWLQVFLHTRKFNSQPLQFFDFFSGPGVDSKGVSGSPLVLLEELSRNRKLLEASHRAVRIVFNDRDPQKVKRLRDLCSQRSFEWAPQFESLDFADAFAKFHKEFGAGPTLVFIDQNGVKHLTQAVFQTLTKQPVTDFIFFVASSFKHRFGDLLAPEIKYPENTSYLDAHRVIADAYREWAPRDMYIGHFSIWKDRNIYGLVFGSHHWRGMCGDLATDRSVFLHCLVNGFLPRVAKDVYKRLHEKGAVKNDRGNYPRYSDAAMKGPRRIQL